jgi:hypothetical protein
MPNVDLNLIPIDETQLVIGAGEETQLVLGAGDDTQLVVNAGDETQLVLSAGDNTQIVLSGASGLFVDTAAKVDRSVVYYDAASSTFRADPIWTTTTLSDGGNF